MNSRRYLLNLTPIPSCPTRHPAVSPRLGSATRLLRRANQHGIMKPRFERRWRANSASLPAILTEQRARTTREEAARIADLSIRWESTPFCWSQSRHTC
jgi:hypothetical protein